MLTYNSTEAFRFRRPPNKHTRPRPVAKARVLAEELWNSPAHRKLAVDQTPIVRFDVKRVGLSQSQVKASEATRTYFLARLSAPRTAQTGVVAPALGRPFRRG